MWIIPNNLNQFSHYVAECSDWSAEFKELLDHYNGQNLELPLMWKSKPLSLKTWSGKWNKVYWLQHLFGQILKPSHHNSFTERYTASLEVIHVNRSPLLETEKEQKTQDTSGPISKPWLEQLDLFGASSKTCPDTSPSDTEKSDQTWNDLVTRLKKEYSARKKLALHTREKDSSSLLWTTHTANDSNRSTKYKQGGMPLSLQVKNWRTPSAEEASGRGEYKDLEKMKKRWEKHQKLLCEQVKELNWPTPNTMDMLPPKSEAALKHEMEDVRPGRKMVSNLRDAVNVGSAWPTPRSSEWKGTGPKGSKSQKYRLEKQYLDATVEEIHGQPVQENSNTSGKSPVLNPAWVLQLMGTTIGKTFFAWQEMVSLNKRQN